MLTRRHFLGLLSGVGAVGFATASYAVGIEPMRLLTTSYRITPPNWPADLKLKIVALADIHACWPWMDGKRVSALVEKANGLGGDIIVLLGDYVKGISLGGRAIPHDEWLLPLSRLSAPLGVHAVLGNHDWWEDGTAQAEQLPETFLHRMLRRRGLLVYSNEARRLEKDGRPFWIAGLEDQRALRRQQADFSYETRSLADLPKTMAGITDDAPIIMMAHEPDIFATMPDRVSITLSGHTHGGQVQMFGRAPMVPSEFGGRYRYGHIVEEGRNLVVSGGLGCTGLPIRFGVPPEIVIVELG
ncbi:metallophosphoesterase [Rhizobium sp. SG2393]|uniref:metallophosphoesterase n=1 Tax=Rhizobium sp. SG2393 TaxID=3276279 RepID=UPI003672DE4C